MESLSDLIADVSQLLKHFLASSRHTMNICFKNASWEENPKGQVLPKASFGIQEFQSSFLMLSNPPVSQQEAIRSLTAPNGIRVTMHRNAHVHMHIAQMWVLGSGVLVPSLAH